MSFLQIALLLGCLILVEQSVAEEYTVGGRAGWRPTTVDYAQWSARNVYHPGDSLFFPYEQGSQSVLRVSKEDYHRCKTNNPIEHHVDGNTIVRLDGDNYYFISGVPGHCHAGMKLEIILGGASPSSTPAVAPATGSLSPAPSPTAPSPSLSSPTPTPSTAPTTAPLTPPAPSPATPTPVPSAPTVPSPSPLVASPLAPLTAPTPSPTAMTPSETPLASSPPAPASPTGSVLPPAEGPGGAPPPSGAFALSSSFASILIAVVIGSSIMSF